MLRRCWALSWRGKIKEENIFCRSPKKLGEIISEEVAPKQVEENKSASLYDCVTGLGGLYAGATDSFKSRDQHGDIEKLANITLDCLGKAYTLRAEMADLLHSKELRTALQRCEVLKGRFEKLNILMNVWTGEAKWLHVLELSEFHWANFLARLMKTELAESKELGGLIKSSKVRLDKLKKLQNVVAKAAADIQGNYGIPKSLVG